MPDQTKEVEIKLKARDETANAFESAKRRMEDFHKETKHSKDGSGDGEGEGIEGLLKHLKHGSRLVKEAADLAGWALVAEGIGKAAEKIGESFEKVADVMEHTHGATADHEAIREAIVEPAIKAIPVVGTLTGGVHKLIDGIEAYRAASLRASGATEEMVDAARSNDGLFDHYTEVVKEQAEAIDSLRESEEALQLERAKFAGGSETHNEQAEQDHNNRTRQLMKEMADLREKFGEEPDDREKQVLADKRQQILLERQRAEEQSQRIDRDARLDTHQLETEHAAKIQSIRDAASQDLARSLRSDGEAEAEALTQRAEADQAAALAAAEARKRGMNPEQQAEITRQANEETEAIQQKYYADIVAMSARAHRDYEQKQKEHEAMMQKIRGDAAVQSLRAQNRDNEAELLELGNLHRAEIEEIDRQNAEKLERLRNGLTEQSKLQLEELEQQILQQKEATDAEFAARRDAAVAQQQWRSEGADLRAHEQAAQAQVDLLRAAGDLGNGIAKIEAERLEIVTQTEAKIAEITRQLREQADLSPKARQDMQQTIDLLKQKEKLDLANVVRRIASADSERHAAPGGEAGRGMIGLNAAAGVRFHDTAMTQEQAMLRLLGVNESINGLLKQISDLVGRILGKEPPPRANAFRF